MATRSRALTLELCRSSYAPTQGSREPSGVLSMTARLLVVRRLVGSVASVGQEQESICRVTISAARLIRCILAAGFRTRDTVGTSNILPQLVEHIHLALRGSSHDVWKPDLIILSPPLFGLRYRHYRPYPLSHSHRVVGLVIRVRSAMTTIGLRAG